MTHTALQDNETCFLHPLNQIASRAKALIATASTPTLTMLLLDSESNDVPWYASKLILCSDGLRCHLSGSLIAKPCTHEEVAFYESSVHHPNIHAFMPQYLGTLTASDKQPSLSIAPGAQNHSRSALSSLVTPSNGFTEKNPASAHHHRHHHHKITPEKAWTPSGGRKLDTGISIVLENIAEGFKRPNVLDVKLGSRLWADDAPPAKRAKLDAVSRDYQL